MISVVCSLGHSLSCRSVTNIMQSYHTEAIVNSEGKVLLSLPFKKGEKVAIVVMPASEALEAKDNEDWVRLGLEHFFKDDSESDSAYDLL
jgi:hypothetical protein